MFISLLIILFHSLSAEYARLNLGLDGIDGRIIAIGDWNSDLKSDIFMSSTNQKLLNILLWDQKSSQFVLKDSISLDNINVGGGGGGDRIVNVIPADFNHDGCLDVMVIGTIFDWLGAEKSSVMSLITGSCGTSTVTISKQPSIQISLPQPFLVDVFGDLKATFIAYNSTSSQLDSFSFQAPIPDHPDFLASPFLVDQLDCQIPHPHSAAFVDMDGDCLADVFLVCKDVKTHRLEFQIWIALPTTGYVKRVTYQLPVGTGQISFADMNADGTVDLVFAVCETSCAVHILYNLQVPLCTATLLTNCRDPTQLCSADPGFSFGDATDMHLVVGFDTIATGYVLVNEDPTFKGVLPMTLRLGDYNNDGYPDILVVAREVADSGVTTALVLQSVGGKGFSVVKGGMDAVNAVKTVVGAVFLDVDGDGALDLLVSYRDRSGEITTASFINKFFFDAFYIKPIVLNGICLGSCPDVRAAGKQPYGVNYAGAVFKYSIMDSNGELRLMQAVQNPQQAYQALSSPNLLGLGRAKNYLEFLFVGVSRRKSDHVASYPGIIPNSGLVISPYESESISGSDSWRLELYMNPSSTTAFIIIFLTLTLLGLSFVILGLDLAERAEDDLERKTRVHAINFDAL